jgi:RHS repeat-associated protein
MPRTYSYVDNLYFLKQGDGPWGTRSWTYDRIGNRLTETRGTTTDTYSYVNHNPRLTSVTMGGGAGTKDFSYDSNGNEIRMVTPLSLLYQHYDGANRLFHMKDDATGAATYLTYDGRNFLTQARQDITTCCSPVLTQAVYSSEGALQGRSVKNILGGTISKDTKVFYFSGRPVGLLEMTTAPATLSYLSVDHLGTPILETNASGLSLWSGGFEPFGKDWNGAQAAGEFLRFPGQWEDGAWAGVAGGDHFYNLYRWYSPLSGSYSQSDPFALAHLPTFYRYSFDNPLRFSDRLGLRPVSIPTAIPPTVEFKPTPLPPPECKPPISPPGLTPALAPLAAWATVLFYEFFVSPSEAGGPGDTRYEPVRICRNCKPGDDDDDRGLCEIQLERCLDHPWQPQWNRSGYGPKKDCGSCYAECVKMGGLWPVYKCPF